MMKSYLDEVDYNIGLDIGTSSVGWSVTDLNNNILKYKGNHMWGVRLFEEAEPAKDRRTFRATRRRMERRKQRIVLLRELIGSEVLVKDEDFFRRLDNSSLLMEDKQDVVNMKEITTLFADNDYTDREYYRTYPTIYHLRKHLCNCKDKQDIRLIYLAVHHILKYRGNFLYGEQQFSMASINLNEELLMLVNVLKENDLVMEYLNVDSDFDFASELVNKNISKSTKVKTCMSHFSGTKEDLLVVKEMLNGVVGLKLNATTMFGSTIEISDEGKDFKISFGDSNYEEKHDQLVSQLGEFELIFDKVMELYSSVTLMNVLAGYNSISEAMIGRYDKHQSDLKDIKTLLKKYDKKTYKALFVSKKKELNNKMVPLIEKDTYEAYVHNPKNAVDFGKKIKVALEKNRNNCTVNEQTTIDRIVNDIDNGNFLPKQRDVSNGTIPYQLNLYELEQIIDNQAKYYPILKEEKEKIISILKFRIPYYVGPLSRRAGEFAWIEKIKDERIYPWNFTEVVDLEKSAEKFITRMTSYCSYLLDEKTLPMKSLLACEFNVLQELNKVKVNDELICKTEKEEIINDLFKKHKKVSVKSLVDWLSANNHPIRLGYDGYSITGLSDDKAFISSLTSYIDFTSKGIVSEINSSNYEIIEQIIYWLTIFEDKKMVRRSIENNYPSMFTEEQLQKITHLNYKGWTSLSKKLIDGLYSKDRNGYDCTIIEVLRNTNMNLMQIINSNDYSFKDQISMHIKKVYENSSNLEDIITGLGGSPALRRGIWQTINIIDEIVHILHHDPKNIFVEFAREDGEKVKTVSRKNKVLKVYEAMNEDVALYFKDALKELKECDNLDDEKLYLYFIQNGKCLYSGTPLDINSLNLYEVDHILPQNLIKDDSLSNKALVLSKYNQSKSGNQMPLAVIENELKPKVMAYWDMLKGANLISDKKYNLLHQESLTEKQEIGFINRQLVETRQITKHVVALLEKQYPKSDVFAIKACLAHDFRESFELYKIRELNDFHHAHDALINSTIGNYIIKVYPSLFKEFKYSDYKKYNNNSMDQRKNRFGFIINSMNHTHVNDSTGEVVWDTSFINSIRNAVYKYNDCLVTKKTEEGTGAFYKQGLCCAGEKLLPIKEKMDSKKYGGYTGTVCAYQLIVEYQKGKKRVKEFVPISVLQTYQINEGKCTLNEIISNTIGTDDFVVLRQKVCNYDFFSVEGIGDFRFAGASDWQNAKQLYLSEDITRKLGMILNKKRLLDDDCEIVDEVLKALISKCKLQYPIFSSINKKIEDNYDVLLKMEVQYKVRLIKDLLTIMHCNPRRVNLLYLNENGATKFTSDEGRISGKSIDFSKTTFVDYSLTGLHISKKKL